MSDKEILDAIEDNREQMYHWRFSHVTGELKNTNEIRNNRRALARLKTVLNQRRLAASSVAGEGK
ncbi:MAG: 50S ribosomal protein L29 [Anaerolineae bacterium]|nr:50S ribosomal protein L29 [Anaerolineae bacterium]